MSATTSRSLSRPSTIKLYDFACISALFTLTIFLNAALSFGFSLKVRDETRGPTLFLQTSRSPQFQFSTQMRARISPFSHVGLDSLVPSVGLSIPPPSPYVCTRREKVQNPRRIIELTNEGIFPYMSRL